MRLGRDRPQRGRRRSPDPCDRRLDDVRLTRVAGKGYFDSADDPASRQAARVALAAQRSANAASGDNPRAGGVVDPLPADAPDFVRDYHAYYKEGRGFHPRSLNSTQGWSAVGIQAYANARFLRYIGEIDAPVMILHGEKAHSRYMGEGAYEELTAGVRPENKELIIIPGASHTDLYDGGEAGPAEGAIPWDRIASFFTSALARNTTH